MTGSVITYTYLDSPICKQYNIVKPGEYEFRYWTQYGMYLELNKETSILYFTLIVSDIDYNNHGQGD